MAKYVVPGYQKSMASQLLKSILLLRRKERCWDAELFGKSIEGAGKENAELIPTTCTRIYRAHKGRDS